jgi:two-component system, cell cycle sensor histidine kinase and response regulator CckA
VRHRLLQRQIRKHLGDEKQLSAEVLGLLEAVEEAYVQFETDRKLVERSMDLSSNELLEANNLLRSKYERDAAVLESLRMSASALSIKGESTSADGSNDLLDLSNLVRQQVHLRAAAEQKIREQAALLDTANDAIYVCSLDGTILYWNQGAERLYGWPSSEALNQPITTFFPDETDWAETALREGSWTGERRRITKNGTPVVAYSRVSLVRDADGIPKSIFAISTDITEKKALEAQFLRGQRMESLGALASGIAHDLNNVLVPVVLGAQLLRSAVKGEDDQRTLADMETSAKRGAEIVRQVLTFARGVEGERLAIQIRHLLKETETIATNTFPKNIQIRAEIAQDLWPVLGDATQLHQALMNLCINARDAMPEGGTLELRAWNAEDVEIAKMPTDRAQVWATADSKPGPHVCVSVTDTGTGISPEILDKIFEPFFTTKEVGKGTGLGLSTVLGIVRSHGGLVRVVSDLGKGSTFEVYFPATPAATVNAVKRTDLELLRGRGQAVMVVDDEQAVRDVASRILDKFGYRSIPMASGREAVLHFTRDRARIDAVITDMAMPGIDGPSLVKILRDIDPSVRIMGMSGHGENFASTKNSWSLGIFLTKPFTVERLLVSLRDLLHVPAGTS